MDQEFVSIVLISCGILGCLLKRNFLNFMSSFLQIILGIHCYAEYLHKTDKLNDFSATIVTFLIISLILFCYSICLLLIRRRSTLNINELAELRG
jgi:NADH:ubiquinone oxidoreductase subunit K